MILEKGGKVLIIGARRSNAPEFWDHPQCVFLDSSDAAYRGIPANARAVIFTRFRSHADFGPIIKEARKRHLTIFSKANTGELKVLLHQMLDRPEPPKVSAEPLPRLVRPDAPPLLPLAPVLPVPEISTYPLEVSLPPMAKTVRHPRGSIQKILGPILQEKPMLSRQDLKDIAADHDVPFTSIQTTYYRMRKKPSEAPLKDGFVNVLNLPRPTTDLVSLVDDAIAALQLVREAATRDANLLHQVRTLKNLLG